MATKSELMSLEELKEELKGKTVIIPLVQRNYKWEIKDENSENKGSENKESRSFGSLADYYEFLAKPSDYVRKSRTSIVSFFKDIKDAYEKNKTEYTIGMATLYKREQNKDVVEILDGQQRMISLSIIAKALGKWEDFIHITFERDTDKKERESFFEINEPKPVEDKVESVDVMHMREACDTINKYLKKERKDGAKEAENWEKEDIENFFDYLMKNVKLICRYTESDPLQEFLSLNEKKTPFSSTDYDRAYQLKYWSDQDVTQEMILKEHTEIQKFLYTNDNLYNLIKKTYHELYNNRMDYLFEKIINNPMEYLFEEENVTIKDKYKDAFNYLKLCHSVLRSIYLEIEDHENSKMNVNVYNAVITLSNLDDNFKFFDLVDIDKKESFEELLKERFNLLGSTYGRMKEKYQNDFLQSQLEDDILKNSTSNEVAEKAYRESEKYISDEIYDLVSKKIRTTEELIERGKKYSLLIKGGKKSLYKILKLEEISQIIIPSIQRDYTLGSNKEYLLNLLFDMSRLYLKSIIEGKEDQEDKREDTASHVVEKAFTEGKLWPIPKWPNGKALNEATKNDLKPYFSLCKLAGDYSEFEVNDTKWFKNVNKTKLKKDAEKILEVLNSRYKGVQYIKDTSFFDGMTRKDIPFILSVIFGYLEETGNFYLYDGQQRIVTIVYLCAYLINKNAKRGEDNYQEYKSLLKKIRFEKREKANQLLTALLDMDNIKLEDIKKEYVVDHSTYSIYKLLETYEKYENRPDDRIMAFDVEFLMKNISFEFAVTQEASIADQLYMDLNSKNEPLTVYENYKAELVYYLESRTKTAYESEWKIQLDNDYLNACYSGEKWEKDKANTAEKEEMLVIHWCFKMACMEYGIAIENIDSPYRLSWMDETDNLEKIVEIVSAAVKTIFESSPDEQKNGEEYKSKISEEFTTNGKRYRVLKKDYSMEEFNLWLDLRYKEKESSYAFEKIKKIISNDKEELGVKIYNLQKEDISNLAEYIKLLTQNKNKDITEDEITKFIIGKCNKYFENGYLEADNPLFSKEDNDKTIVDLEKLNYFDASYLNEKEEKFPKDAQDMIEYIYSVKLWERLNIKLYDKVKVWEEKELKKLENPEKQKIFESEEKRLAKKYLNGNYYLYHMYASYIETFNNNINIEYKDAQELSNQTLPELPDIVVTKLSPAQLEMCQVKQVMEDSLPVFEINLHIGESQAIYDKVGEYIIKEPNSQLAKNFVDKIKDNYYFERSGNDLKFWEWDETEQVFTSLNNQDFIKYKFQTVNKEIKVSVQQVSDKLEQLFDKNTNSIRIKYNLTIYCKGESDRKNYWEEILKEFKKGDIEKDDIEKGLSSVNSEWIKSFKEKLEQLNE